MKNWQNMGVSHNISMVFCDSLNEWKASFKSSTNSTSHFEFPNTENVSLTNG